MTKRHVDRLDATNRECMTLRETIPGCLAVTGQVSL